MTIMITHNMADAIRVGNRLIMMHEGQIVVDVKGEEKKKLTIEELLHMFEPSAVRLKRQIFCALSYAWCWER